MTVYDRKTASHVDMKTINNAKNLISHIHHSEIASTTEYTSKPKRQENKHATTTAKNQNRLLDGRIVQRNTLEIEGTLNRANSSLNNSKQTGVFYRSVCLCVYIFQFIFAFPKLLVVFFNTSIYMYVWLFICTM